MPENAPRPWDVDVTLRVWAVSEEDARDEANHLLDSADAEHFGVVAREGEQ